MAKINLRGLVNLDTTQSRWVEAVLARLQHFSVGSCVRRKESFGNGFKHGFSLSRSTQDILIAMTDLAIEELAHYKQVINPIIKRGLIPQSDRKDNYVTELIRKARKGRDEFSRQVAHRSTDRAERSREIRTHSPPPRGYPVGQFLL